MKPLILVQTSLILRIWYCLPVRQRTLPLLSGEEISKAAGKLASCLDTLCLITDFPWTPNQQVGHTLWSHTCTSTCHSPLGTSLTRVIIDLRITKQENIQFILPANIPVWNRIQCKSTRQIWTDLRQVTDMFKRK